MCVRRRAQPLAGPRQHHVDRGQPTMRLHTDRRAHNKTNKNLRQIPPWPLRLRGLRRDCSGFSPPTGGLFFGPA